MEDPWHNWHKPEEALKVGGCCCGTGGKQITPPRTSQCQRWWQNHIMLTQCYRKALLKREPWYLSERDDIPEAHHSHWRSSSHSHCGSRDLKQNEIQERNSMKYNRHPSNQSSKQQLTDWEQWMYWQTPKCLTDMLMPPRPQHVGCILHITCRYPLEHTDVQGSMGVIQMCGVGYQTWYGALKKQGDIQLCNHMGGPPSPYNPTSHADTL